MIVVGSQDSAFTDGHVSLFLRLCHAIPEWHLAFALLCWRPHYRTRGDHSQK
jgi:hypothetical protein